MYSYVRGPRTWYERNQIGLVAPFCSLFGFWGAGICFFPETRQLTTQGVVWGVVLGLVGLYTLGATLINLFSREVD